MNKIVLYMPGDVEPQDINRVICMKYPGEMAKTSRWIRDDKKPYSILPVISMDRRSTLSLEALEKYVTELLSKPHTAETMRMEVVEGMSVTYADMPSTRSEEGHLIYVQIALVKWYVPVDYRYRRTHI